MKPIIVLVALLLCVFIRPVNGDTFGSGSNSFNIDFVTIGNPNNPADTSGVPNPAGAVAYTYRIGTYEVSEQMIDKANFLGGLGIFQPSFGANKPATYVSWNEAARFVNWLNSSTGSPLAYKFVLQPGETGYDATAINRVWTPSDAGYNPNNLYRNSLARYFLPSDDEWYKAAYYDPANGVYYDFPTGSDIAPIPVTSGTAPGSAVYSLQSGPADITLAGGSSPYGTMAQGGNVYEWEETEFDYVNDAVSFPRGVRGGSAGSEPDFLRATNREVILSPATREAYVGFRIASTFVPEPSTVFFAASIFAVLGCRNRRRN
jgi:sulfatase modifying factor 1